MPSLKEKLQTSDARLSGVVCTIPSATVTQALAASGVDAVIVDLEHGAVDYGSAHAMIAATQGTRCPLWCGSLKTRKPKSSGCWIWGPKASSFS